MKLVYLLGRQVLSKSLYQLPAYFNKNNSTKVAEAHVVYIQFPLSGTGGGQGFAGRSRTSNQMNTMSLGICFSSTGILPRWAINGVWLTASREPIPSSRNGKPPALQLRGEAFPNVILLEHFLLYLVSVYCGFIFSIIFYNLYMGLVIHLLAHTSRAVDHSNSSEWQFVMKYSGN